jgi:GNAT superfamily N-acetyltransferase
MAEEFASPALATGQAVQLLGRPAEMVPDKDGVYFAEDGAIGVTLAGVALDSYVVTGRLERGSSEAVVDNIAVVPELAGSNVGLRLLTLIRDACRARGVRTLDIACLTPAAIELREQVFGKAALRFHHAQAGEAVNPAELNISSERAREFLAERPERSIRARILLQQLQRPSAIQVSTAGQRKNGLA